MSTNIQWRTESVTAPDRIEYRNEWDKLANIMALTTEDQQ